jgi:PhnB protein
MKQVGVYLYFEGRTFEAFEFYRSIFGGEFGEVRRFKDMPGEGKISDADQERIMYITLRMTDEFSLMGSDTMVEDPPLRMGTNVHIEIQAESEEEARRLFAGLSRGGEVAMPIEKQFWNALYGMVTDRYGIQWMVNYQLE